MSVIAPGLLVWLRLNGNSSDYSGNDLSITPASSPSYAQGRSGLCALFDASDDLVSIAKGQYPKYLSYGLNPLAAATFCAWISPTGTPTNAYGVIAMSGSGTVQFGYGYNNPNTSLFVNDDAHRVNVTLSGWNHVALVCNGSTNNLYLNAQYLYGYSCAQTFCPNDWDTELGQSGSYGFYGSIADFMVFDRALSTADLATVMTGGFPP